MFGSSPLHEFVLEWACYLQQQGHRVRVIHGAPAMLRSRNGRGERYRWLFLHAEGPARRLTAIEHEQIQRQLRTGRKSGEQVYLVVRFERPFGRVIAVPAARVAKAARLDADKGGIPWDW